MAKLILDGKKLSALIVRNVGQRAKVNVESHLAACSALMLAVNDGRCNWLNEMFAGLDRLSQDAFKAWLLPINKAWYRGKVSPETMEHNKARRWIKFESKSENGKTPRGFYIDVKGNKNWKADAPTAAEVETVADDLSLAFFNTTAATIQKDNNAFNVDALIKQFESLAKKLENAATEGKIVVNTKLIQQATELAVAVSRPDAVKLKLATVDGQRVDTAPNPNDMKSEQAKKAAANIRDKVKADLKAQAKTEAVA